MFELEQLIRIRNIDELQLDQLLDVSLPAMNDGTYIWPKDIITDQQKKDYYRSNLIRILSSGEIVFAFKRVVNGVDVSFNIGLRDSDGYWVYLHALVGHLNGSRSWIFDENITPQQTQFLNNAGFKGIVISSFGESDALKHQLKKYESLAGVLVHERWKEIPDKGLLLTKIDFTSSDFYNAG